jgi:hypothetical protein
MRAWGLPVLAAALAAACNFDAAFDRYCESNPLCKPDSGAALSDAGSSDGSRAGTWPMPRNCTDCQSDEICNPFGKVCMRTCTSAADCLVGEDSCIALLDPGGNPLPQKTCTCTASSCGGGAQCSQVDNLCEERCSSNADCNFFHPPRMCTRDHLCMQPTQ